MTQVEVRTFQNVTYYIDQSGEQYRWRIGAVVSPLSFDFDAVKQDAENYIKDRG